MPRTQTMIKNLEPMEKPKGWDKRRISDFWEDATLAQKQTANNFLRTHWLIRASRHKNQKVWFLTFGRLVYLLGDQDESEIKTCHEEEITIWLDRNARIKSYRSTRRQII